jgi:hypothetical protein
MRPPTVVSYPCPSGNVRPMNAASASSASLIREETTFVDRDDVDAARAELARE